MLSRWLKRLLRALIIHTGDRKRGRKDLLYTIVYTVAMYCRERNLHMAHAAQSTILARDIMTTDPITVDTTTTARELARVLTDNNISGVPVVNAQDRLVGVVSKTDLLQWCVTGGLGLGADDLLPTLAKRRADRFDDLGIVEDFMSVEPVTCLPDEPVNAVAKRMAEEQVHRIVVVDERNEIIGIITSLDLLRVFPS